MTAVRNLSRRRFLELSGSAAAALVLGVRLPGCSRPGGGGAGEFRPNVFITLDASGDVRIVANRAEMGQGIRTGLPMVVADEMEADWSRVSVEQSDGTPQFGDQATDGSKSVRLYYTAMREAGAACRTMLEQAAAGLWGVALAECRAELHQVRHLLTGRVLGYGELAEAAAELPVPPRESLILKGPEEFRYIGKDLALIDLPDIVRGRAIYGADLVVPDMVFAVVARSPGVGGRVERLDDREARQVPGVLDVVLLEGAPPPAGFMNEEGVAVVAESTWAAIRGRDRLVIAWRDGPAAAYDSQAYLDRLGDLEGTDVRRVRDLGDVERAFASAERTVSGRYRIPHLTHAAMEPLVATAHRRPDGVVELWAPVQYADVARAVAAEAAGVEPDRVVLHQTLLGGAFGRKAQMDFVAEAVKLAGVLGRPVRVQWTREDDMRHGYYHALSVQKLEAALDGENRVTGWRHRLATNNLAATFESGVRFLSDDFLNQGTTDMPFAIPSIRVENLATDTPVRIGWCRSVYNLNSAFAIGSFLDELASAREMDPIDGFLDLLGPDRRFDYPGVILEGERVWNYDESVEEFPFETGRLRRVVERVREESGWESRRAAGRHLGFAAHRSFLTYVACVVEAVVDVEGRVSVPRVDYAVDCGTVVNPDQVRAQFEGGAIFALSHALHGRLTIAGGRTVESNFDDYPVVRMDEAPEEIHVHLMESAERPTGVGEPPVPPLAPALCNAIFRATGRRVRDLPVGRQLST
ncbi:MAG TPA: molybdopterin cofactor-binding domain-containing protein [Thermoanaerobaculia bacterium]|nr:molybdopterin cofactor-binding domain-containing protein [Thermoanaerobaculia bacterium]